MFYKLILDLHAHRICTHTGSTHVIVSLTAQNKPQITSKACCTSAVGLCDSHGDGHSFCGGLSSEPSHLLSKPASASSAGYQHSSGG